MRLARACPLLLLTVAFAPIPADADARDYPGQLGRGDRGSFKGRGDFGRRHHHHRHQKPRTVVVYPGPYYYADPTPAYTSPPPIVYAPPQVIYAAPPVSYAAPAPSYAPSEPPPAPTMPPPPRVVEFDTGRYELRGDGVSLPYTWVWVPNAPSAPPGPPPAPRPPATVYRWTDDNGVTTFTDDPNKVPAQFRALSIKPAP